MGKIDAEMQGRMAGMNYALNVAKQKGIEGLEKEIKARGALGVGLKVDNKRLQEGYRLLTAVLYQNIMTTTLMTLIDTFCFGEKRLKRFKAAYDEKALMIVDLDGFCEHYVTFEDMGVELKEKYHIDMDVEMMASNQNVIDEDHNRRVLPRIIELLESKEQKKAADLLREYLHEEVANVK